MHDISWSSVQPLYTSSKETQALLDQVGKAFGSGIFATPTFLVNGTPVYYGQGGSHLIGYLTSVMRMTPKSK